MATITFLQGAVKTATITVSNNTGLDAYVSLKAALTAAGATVMPTNAATSPEQLIPNGGSKSFSFNFTMPAAPASLNLLLDLLARPDQTAPATKVQELIGADAAGVATTIAVVAFSFGVSVGW